MVKERENKVVTEKQFERVAQNLRTSLHQHGVCCFSLAPGQGGDGTLNAANTQ